jgi:hypothetical protein
MPVDPCREQSTSAAEEWLPGQMGEDAMGQSRLRELVYKALQGGRTDGEWTHLE